MPTWLDEWTVLYIVFLTAGYIAIFTFLDRYNRRKKKGNLGDKPGHGRQMKTEANRPSN